MSFSTVNLFFACDERYLPFFSVTLASIKEHRDQNRLYVATVLHTDIPTSTQKALQAVYTESGFRLRFRDVSREVAGLVARLHTRDYYSHATYYRLLIPTLYPRMKKALYLDSDILLLSDVAKLYDTPLYGQLAGAVADGFVNRVPVLRHYVENRVGVPKDVPYFNAGVLLMNLAEMRKIGFGDLFVFLLHAVTFRVAQDQDYLNVICRGRVIFLPDTWNYMPFEARMERPALVHFNLDNKPWQRREIPYAEDFWACAQKTPYFAALCHLLDSYSEEDRVRAAEATEHLVALAVAEGADENENRQIARRIRFVMQKGGAWNEGTSLHPSTRTAVCARDVSALLGEGVR